MKYRYNPEYLEYCEWRKTQGARVGKNYIPKQYHSKPERLRTINPHTEVGRLAAQVLKDLEDIGAFVYHAAVSGHSVYIKFGNPCYKTLRISNHPQRKKRAHLQYKWNLCVGWNPRPKDDHFNRCYFHPTHLPQFYKAIRSCSPQ